MTPNISIINSCSVLTDAEIETIAKALQQQVTHDYAPIWGQDAQLDFVPKGHTPPAGHWWLTFLDDADVEGALGYHDLTPEDLPVGKVFCRTTLQDGGKPSVTASHELLEMLGDPFINQAAIAPSADGNSTLIYAYENCDACEDDQFGYNGLGNVRLSDFVFPRFFDPNASASEQLDFMKKVKKPFEILQGGYLSVLSTTNGWSQITASNSQHHSSTERYFGNRFFRRRYGHLGEVKRSTAHTGATSHSRSSAFNKAVIQGRFNNFSPNVRNLM